MENAGGRDIRHNSQVERGQRGGKDILGHHHLRTAKTRIGLGRGEDMVLCGVREAIQQKVNGQQKYPI